MRILLAPWLTEKAVRQGEQGLYTFKVAKGASKQAVAQAVQAQFGVQVVSVTVQNLDGKTLRMRGKHAPRRTTVRPSRRKATVRLKPGQTIDLYAGIGE